MTAYHITNTSYANIPGRMRENKRERRLGQYAKSSRNAILDALWAWIRQRPGLDFRDYGEVSSYRAELRSITQDLHDARTLLRAIELSSMTADTLKGGFRAYSGRLEWKGGKVEYCTGQYWPTEYRRVVCAVAASALWDYHREDFAASAKGGESPGDAIRRNFKRLFGRRLQARWFE